MWTAASPSSRNTVGASATGGRVRGAGPLRRSISNCPLAGLGHEGIYRKNGAKSRIKLLMEEFRKDARNVKLRMGDHFIEDVTDVLKRFFREIDDHVFMADLHPLWREAASESTL